MQVTSNRALLGATRFDPLAAGRLAAAAGKEGERALPGARITRAPKNSKHKGVINDLTAQSLAAAKALEVLGDGAWPRGCKSGERRKEALSALTEAQGACGCEVQRCAFLRRQQRFLRLGEAPARDALEGEELLHLRSKAALSLAASLLISHVFALTRLSWK